MPGLVQFNANHKAVIDELLSDQPEVRPGKMFGFPAYYAGKKLCICLYEDGVGVKLPQSTVAKLLATDKNTIPFQPYGKAVMREWIQINLELSEDYRHYKPLFEESIRFLVLKQKDEL